MNPTAIITENDHDTHMTTNVPLELYIVLQVV